MQITPEDHYAWEETWGIVAGMEGLQDLDVALTQWPTARSEYFKSEQDLLRPLQMVKKPEKFQVYVSWPACVRSVPTEDAPYRLRRPGHDVD